MTPANPLQDLITELCPQGVKYKTLGELGILANMGVDKKSKDGQKEIALLNFVDVMRNPYIDRNIPTMKTTASDSEIAKCDVLKNDLFITPSSENKDEIGFASVILEDLPGVCYSYHIMRFRIANQKISPYFLRYCFEADCIRNQILQKAQGITRFGLTQPAWKSLQIPIPPINIQNRIVEILDTFTELERELERELSARKKQYEHYRNTLLSFESLQKRTEKLTGGGARVRMCNLGEVCGFQNGFSFKANLFKTEGLPIIRISNLQNNLIDSKNLVYFQKSDYPKTDLNDYLVKQGNILIAMSGATTGKVGIMKENKALYLNQRVGKFLPDNKLLNGDFLYHFLLTKTDYFYRLAGGGAQPNLNSTKIIKIQIPLPPIEVQNEVVEILDRFDVMVGSITEGLPAEIQARKKQYEYYRDRLLSFGAKGA